jgi:hypothetical protein
MSARDRIREFLETNVGRVVTTKQIGRVAGISDYQRRIRELRDEEGMQIRSHIDREDLAPGQYVLESLRRLPVVGRGMSPQLRNAILERNGYTCQLCGAGAGDPDPTNPSRKARLHVDHDTPISQGGTDDPSNLRVLCSACNQGRANIQPASEDARNILARLRRASRAVRKEVYEALKRQFAGR